MSLTQQLSALPEPLRARFQLKRKLGQGSYALVYQIRERKTGELFALKVVDKAPLVARNQVDALMREVSILKMHAHSPHVVRLHEFHEIAGRFYLVFDCCDQNLEDASQGRPFRAKVAFEWLRQACEGLLVLHNSGVIHRDLKPGNFLVDRHGSLQICDFGFACFEEDGARDLAGSPAYAAPEVLGQQRAHTDKVDVYSLGRSVQHLLLGRPPQGPLDMPAKLSKQARFLLSEMTHPDPEERPSIHDILQQLHADDDLLQQMVFHGSTFLASLKADVNRKLAESEMFSSTTSLVSTQAPSSSAPSLLPLAVSHDHLMHVHAAVPVSVVVSHALPGQRVKFSHRRCVSSP